jgi:uncharacterized coiled-coil protein SlyX
MEDLEKHLKNQTDTMMQLHEMVVDYKDRIDKAIEYINEMTLTSSGYADYGDDLRPEHIIDILKGSDKE